ncbi:MAG: hypothetical protein U1A72_17770 [Sulfuritalea sp.]|nr:hypothetical protein [Sulfuritalea sp.]
MNSPENSLISVMVVPVSNELRLGGSVLPDRFVSGSEVQSFPIMGDDFNSSVRLSRSVVEVIVPANITAGHR